MSAAGRPLPAGPPAGSRGALVQHLLDDLLDRADHPLPLGERTVDDPTVALLDAWATMADVVAFYDERIRAEGYLGSALQPESVLALAGLTGTRPRPGLAASVHLAYHLYPDPTDAAVVLASGLLCQTVPGPGEQVQTFETATELVARPSWNELPLLSGRPPTAVPEDGDTLVELSVAGTATRVGVNTHLVWQQEGAAPVLLRVREAAADPVAGTTALVATTVPLPSAVARATPDPGPHPDAAPATTTPSPAPAPAPAGPDDGRADTVVLARPPAGPADPPGVPPRDPGVLSALTGLKGPLDLQPPSRPAASSRTARQIFSATSDTTPRLMAALQPGLASTLYSAIATSRTATAGPPSLSVLRVTAAPFGAAAPLPVVLDPAGRVTTGQDWPLAGSLTLALTVPVGAAQQQGGDQQVADRTDPATGTLGEAARSLARAVAESWARSRPATASVRASTLAASATVTASAEGFVDQRRRVVAHQAPQVDLGELGQLTSRQADDYLTISYRPPDALPSAGFDLGVSFDREADAASFVLDSDTVTWSPADRSPLRSTLAGRELTISWSADHSELTFALSTRLPYSAQRVLDLDARYPGIGLGSTVAITAPAGAAVADGPSYPLVTTVQQADTVTLTRYGQTARVTRLLLADAWIGKATSLAAVRDLEVHAQPELLTLRPAPVDDDVEGATLELDGVHAGLDAGRAVLVTGRRADLPDGAVVGVAELAVLDGVDLVVDPDGTAHTALRLTGPLTYAYARSSVTLHGNVVAAHQGATVTEVLGSGDPRVAHQTFTVAGAPVLSDATSSGVTSSLVVRVDGLRYEPVTRLDAASHPTSYLLGQDPSGHTVVTFAAALAAGTGNVTATYRSGSGAQGDVRAGQVSQPLSRPLAVSTVTNPLPASGGADPEGPQDLRGRVGVGLGSSGRPVSLEDYADAALAWPGVGKAAAVLSGDGPRRLVRLHVAGTGPRPLLQDSDLVAALAASLAPDERGTQLEVVAVLPLTIMLRLRIVRSPAQTWSSVVAGVQSRLGLALGYDRRAIGEDVLLGPVVAAVQSAPGVLACAVAGLALVSADTTPEQLAGLGDALAQAPPERTAISGGGAGGPAEVAFVDPTLPESVLCEEQLP